MAANVAEARRRLTIEATSRGVDGATRSLQQLGRAHEGVTVSSQRQERATQSLDRRLNSLQRRYDETYRVQMQMQKVERDLAAAQQQGLITSQRRLELLSLAAEKHGLATAAIQTETLALQMNAKASRYASMMSRQLSFQLVDIGQALATAPTMGIYALQNIGFQLAQIGQLYMGQGGFKAALSDSLTQVGKFATKMGPAIGVTALLAAAFGGLTYEINQTTDVAVGFGDTALATIQVFGGYIMDTLKPAINAIAPWFASAWSAVVTGFKTVNNFLIAGWGTVFDVITTGATNIPDAFIAAGDSAANKFIQSMAWMARETVVIINGLLGQLDTAADGMGMPRLGLRLDMPKVPAEVDLGGDAASERLAKSWGDIADRARKRFATDYAGDIFGDIRDQAIENALAGEKDKKNGGKSDAERLAKRYKHIVLDANQATDALHRQTDALFMTEEAAAEVYHQQELLNKAQDAGITLTAKQTAELMGLGSALGAAEIAYQKTREALDFAKSTAKSFFGDVRSSFQQFRSEGLSVWESLWRSMGNAAVNAIDKIISKISGDLIDSLFQIGGGASRGGGSGFGGIMSSLFGGIFGSGFPAAPTLGVGLYHSGGIAGQAASMRMAEASMFINAPRYHNGGIAGLKPDEIPAILQRGERITPRSHVANGSGMAANSNYQRGPVNITINGAGLDQEQMTQAIGDALDNYDRFTLPGRVNAINKDPLARG